MNSVQPSKLFPFDLNFSKDSESKRHSQTHSHGCSHPHHRHTLRARLPLLILSITLFLLLAIFLFLGDTDEVIQGSIEGIQMLKRQINGGGTNTPGGTNRNTPFVKNKLYLIVVIVGFFVVLFLAVMLSAWCCRGAFQNPLCCPCYLCACCGGLACLECVGCGLCAEGLSDLNV